MTNQTVTSHARQVGITISGSLAGFMVLLDNNIVNISLHDIAKYFDISTPLVVQVALVYLLMLSGTMIIFGKLADNYGIKRVFISGFIVFTVSSLLCGLTPTFSLLIAARILQGIGGSMLFSTMISLITKFIPPDRRGWAFGIFFPISSMGLLIGNPLGGLITGMLSWHWIFLVNIPVGILATILGYKTIPADYQNEKKPTSIKHFDYLGSLLSFFGLAMMVYFISNGKSMGWGSPLTIGGLVGSLVLITAFILWEKRSRDPILDLSIFRDRSFSYALMASLVGYGLMAGSNVILPFYILLGLKIDVTHAGFILMTFAVVFSLSSLITGRLSDKVPRVHLTILGMALATISCIAFALLLPLLHLGILFGFLVMLGISYALFITPNNNMVMSIAREDKVSISSSVFKLSTNMGQMFGLILMQMIFTMGIHHSPGETGFKLKSMPATELMSGFSWAYIAGAAMCVAAILFSLFIRENRLKHS